MSLEISSVDHLIQCPSAPASNGPSALDPTRRILVVDDDADTRELTCNLLSRAGYLTESAVDGEEAWNAVRSTHYDLVLTDHNMPRLSGLELAARMRAAGMTIPIIINSGCTFFREQREFPELNLAAIIEKSCEWTEIVDAVKRIIPLKDGMTPTALAFSPLMKTSAPSKTTGHDTSNLRGNDRPDGEPGARPAAGISRSGRRILLVDDDPTVRDSLNDVLLAEGYHVIPAENGQQALDLVSQSAVDLVLLDLNMPIKNGWDTFERLTTEHPFIPVIIVTARPNQFFMALNAGAGALLEKPMDIPVLLQTMNKLLAESGEERLARLAGKKAEFYYKPAAA